MTTDSQQWFIEKDKNGLGYALAIEEKLEEVITPFQKIEIYKTTSFGNLMVIDGCIMLTSRDNFLYHEMMVHPIVFTHPNPKNVAIIGGGDCGTLREVLKHSNIEQVTQIDIDEHVTRLSEKYFPELCTSNNDSRATLLFNDGLLWMEQALPKSLDIIIVDSTDPIGPGEGLFGATFYKTCAQALKDDGLLIHQSESPLIHTKLLKEMRQAMSEAGLTTQKTLTFPQPCYPSGWWSATIATKLTALPAPRTTDISSTQLHAQYFNQEIFSACFAQSELLKKICL